jgi:hypothetical protein
MAAHDLRYPLWVGDLCAGEADHVGCTRLQYRLRIGGFGDSAGDEDGDLGRRGYVVNSLGRGGTVQSVLFAETVLRSAWDLASMATAVPSLGSLYGALDESVDVLRRALAGEPLDRRRLAEVALLAAVDQALHVREHTFGIGRKVSAVERGRTDRS